MDSKWGSVKPFHPNKKMIAHDVPATPFFWQQKRNINVGHVAASMAIGKEHTPG